MRRTLAQVLEAVDRAGAAVTFGAAVTLVILLLLEVAVTILTHGFSV